MIHFQTFRHAFALVLLAGSLACGASNSNSPAPQAPASGASSVASHPDAAAADDGEVTQINAELSAKQISVDAFVVTHKPFYAANVLVVKMPDGTVIFCSSPYETEATRALVNWVSTALKPTKMIAINTHFHFDGTGGNEAYRELGVTTFASEQTQKLLAEKGKALQIRAADDFEGAEKSRVLAMKITSAEKTFSAREGLALSFGGEAVNVIYPGPAHAPDNVLVHFPARRILFGGCMIKASRSIGYTGDADLEHWEAAVDVARKLQPKIVVPGHGAVSGPDLLDLTTTVVRAARTQSTLR